MADSSLAGARSIADSRSAFQHFSRLAYSVCQPVTVMADMPVVAQAGQPVAHRGDDPAACRASPPGSPPPSFGHLPRQRVHAPTLLVGGGQRVDSSGSISNNLEQKVKPDESGRDIYVVGADRASVWASGGVAGVESGAAESGDAGGAALVAQPGE